MSVILQVGIASMLDAFSWNYYKKIRGLGNTGKGRRFFDEIKPDFRYIQASPETIGDGVKEISESFAPTGSVRISLKMRKNGWDAVVSKIFSRHILCKSGT